MLPILLLIQLAATPASAPVPAPPDTTRQLTQFKLERWMDRDGLPQNSINALAQTTDRFLWLASEEGLIRFDGQQFVIFNRSNTPALERSQILSLAAAHDGTLWIGTAFAGLLSYRHGHFTAYRTDDGIPDDRVQALAIADDGVVWAGTSAGLLRIDAAGAMTTITSDHGLPGDDVIALATEPGGVAWVGTRSGLARIEAGTIQRFGSADGLPGESIRALAPAHGGGAWVSTNAGGVGRFDDGRYLALDARLSSDIVQTILDDGSGAIWLGTNGNGLARWRGGRVERLDNRTGAADLVWSLARGEDGTLWVGTNGRGLLQLRKTPFVPLGEAEGLSGDIALAILEARDGNRWIGTAGAGLNRLAPDGTITRFGAANGLAAGMILALAELPDGDMMIGSLNGSLTRYRNGRFTDVGRSLQLRPSVLAILPDHDGAYWLGTAGGVFFVRDGRMSAFTADDGLADGFVMALHRAADDAIWVGTRQGLSRIENGRVVPLAPDVQLAGVPIGAFHDPGDGSFWVATQGHGIARVTADGARFLDHEQGLCDDIVHAIIDDGDGFVWMSSNKGVFRIAAAALDAFFAGTADSVPCELFGTAEGMRSREANGGFMPAGARLADGTLMFPTMEGVVSIDPRALAERPQVPPAVLRFAVLGADTLPLAALGGINVVDAGRSLELHFTAPVFDAPERLRFRYRLDGFDTDWHDAGARRTAYYTNLPPGDFAFRVTVSNGGDEWNPIETTLRVAVPARFHETLWFLALCIVAVIATVFMLHRVRMTAVRRRAERLAVLVDERTRAEERYRELFENARAMQEQLQHAAKMEAVGRLAGGVAHDFNNLLTVITSYSAMLESDLPDGSALRDDVDQIRRAADSAAGLTRQLLAFSRRQVLQPRILDVNRETTNVVGMLRRIIGVNIAFETEFMPDIWPVHADAGQLEQVLMNLALNARDAMPDGGTLRFRTANVELGVAPEQPAAARDGRELEPGRYVVLSVEDSGSGIDAAALPHVFEPFFTTKGAGRGTGLGLATVYGVVQQSGGQIFVYSEPGHGTRFDIYLPAAAVAPPGEDDAAADSYDACRVPAHASILVVDDEAAVMALTRKILVRGGFQVREAASGSEALRILEQHGAVDLLLTDIMMPGMDGRELAQHVLDAFPGTSILYMSGYTEDEVIRRGVLPRGEHFIGKPFTPAGLIAVVHDALGAVSTASD